MYSCSGVGARSKVVRIIGGGVGPLTVSFFGGFLHTGCGQGAGHGGGGGGGQHDISNRFIFLNRKESYKSKIASKFEY